MVLEPLFEEVHPSREIERSKTADYAESNIPWYAAHGKWFNRLQNEHGFCAVEHIGYRGCRNGRDKQWRHRGHC